MIYKDITNTCSFTAVLWRVTHHQGSKTTHPNMAKFSIPAFKLNFRGRETGGRCRPYPWPVSCGNIAMGPSDEKEQRHIDMIMI